MSSLGGGSAVLMVLILQFNSLGKLGKDVRGSNALGVLGGSHAVGRNLTAQGDEADAKLGEAVLDLVGGSLVGGKAVLKRLGALDDGLEAGLERVDKLDGGCRNKPRLL